jgi:phenylacetate-CoA ligase
MKYWDEKFETMPLEEMGRFQLEHLKKTVKWVYEKIPFYRNRFDEQGIKPEDIKTLEDLSRLPFTAKSDLRDNYPFGLCAVPCPRWCGSMPPPEQQADPVLHGQAWSNGQSPARNFMQRVSVNDICQNAYGMLQAAWVSSGASYRCCSHPDLFKATERRVWSQDFGVTVSAVHHVRIDHCGRVKRWAWSEPPSDGCFGQAGPSR